VIRLLECLKCPLDSRVLGPQVVRVIIYRVLREEKEVALRAVWFELWTEDGTRSTFSPNGSIWRIVGVTGHQLNFFGKKYPRGTRQFGGR
jgi:AraC-type transcriptional regulator N-terminus